MRGRNELEIIKSFVDSTYSNFGNRLIVDTSKTYNPLDEKSNLGFCFKHIDPVSGGVIYKIDCSKIGIERTDFRIMMHEYAHIYLGHMDNIHEELDVQICNAFRDHRPEILEGIMKNCGIDESTANKLLERIIDDPQLNHEIHNIAMDMECNSSVLSDEDVEEMELDITSIFPKYEEELLKKAIDAASADDYKKTLEDTLKKMESEAKIKLILPSRYYLGKDENDEPIPFPNDLGYADYLLLIIMHIDQFVKMLVSIQMGGNGDTKDITKEDVQNALSGMLQKMQQHMGAGQQSEAFRQGYQQALRDARQGKIDPSQMAQNPQPQLDGKSEEFKKGFAQGVNDTVNKNFGSPDFKQGYQDGYNDQMNQQNQGQNQGQQDQGNGQSGNQSNQTGQNGQQGNQGSSQQQPGGNQGQSGQQGQNGQTQSGQGQSGMSQDYQNGYQAGQRDAQTSQTCQNGGSQQSQGQSGDQQNQMSGQGQQDGQDNMQSQGQGQKPGGQTSSQSGQNAPGNGQNSTQGGQNDSQSGQQSQGGGATQGQQDYAEGYQSGKDLAQNSIDNAQKNGGQSNGQGQNQNGQNQGQGQQGQGQDGQDGSGDGQGQGQGQGQGSGGNGMSQEMQDFNNGYQQALQDLANSQNQGMGQGLSNLMQQMGISSGGGMGQPGGGPGDCGTQEHNKQDPGQKKGHGRKQKDTLNPFEGAPGRDMDHFSDDRVSADKKREAGQIQAGGGVGMGRGNGPDVVREVDKFADDVDMALNEVMNDIHSRVVKSEIQRDMMKLYNRGIVRSVIAPSLSRKVTISTKPKLVFLIDISGSMDTRLIDRILCTISRSLKKINRDLRYDIITWSDRMGEHLKNIDPRKPVPKISCGGGTEMARGMKYFKEHYGPEAILILISDFCDSLDQWHEVEKTMSKYSIWGFNYGDNRYSYKRGDWDWTYFKQRDFSDYGYDS